LRAGLPGSIMPPMRSTIALVTVLTLAPATALAEAIARKSYSPARDERKCLIEQDRSAYLAEKYQTCLSG
jgi:hypothetical protein